MAYMIGGLVGAGLVVLLLTRLALWIAGKFSAGYARVGWGYAIVAVFLLVLAMIGGGVTGYHGVMLVAAVAFDLWRVGREPKRSRQPVELHFD